MTQTNLDETSVASDVYEPIVVLDPEIANVQPASIAHTYHPTRWPFINNLLDTADSITHGRAGQLQTFISFAFLGGLASAVNLAVLYVVYYHSLKSVDSNVRQVIAFLLASEISIVVNFALNDYFTFRYLPGHERSWRARCLRFHMTSTSAILLTFLINFSLTHGLHASFFVAQAVAILIVLFYNFAVHHLFTYRQVKPVVVQ
jgi:putative flippase GtrA